MDTFKTLLHWVYACCLLVFTQLFPRTAITTHLKDHSLDHGVLNVQYSWSMSRLDTPVFNLLIFMTSESMHYLDDSHYSPVSSQHLLRLCFEFGYKNQS